MMAVYKLSRVIFVLSGTLRWIRAGCMAGRCCDPCNSSYWRSCYFLGSDVSWDRRRDLITGFCLLRLRKAVPDSSSSTGILIPLCESGTCTLREAIIIGSILTKCSIPVLHSR